MIRRVENSMFWLELSILLVALYLHDKKTGSPGNSLSKDKLYVKAEELNITKNPFSGGTTQTGPHHCDGWSFTKTPTSLLIHNFTRLDL